MLRWAPGIFPGFSIRNPFRPGGSGRRIRPHDARHRSSCPLWPLSSCARLREPGRRSHVVTAVLSHPQFLSRPGRFGR